MISFRSLYKRLVPWWLRDEAEGAPILYSLGILADAVDEHARAATEVRFPEYAPTDALAHFARDRRIVRGIGESRAGYNARLLRWLDDHRTRGNPFALMRQLRAYCNAAVRLRTVDARGNWYTLERDGSRSFVLDQGNWDWDGRDPAVFWSRFWVIVYPTVDLQPWGPGPAIGAATLWTTGNIGTPGATIGTTATVNQVGDVQRIVRDWKPAGTRCVSIIIAFDDASFAPAGGSLPDGTWANHLQQTGDPRVPGRLSTARYWEGR